MLTVPGVLVIPNLERPGGVVEVIQRETARQS